MAYRHNSFSIPQFIQSNIGDDPQSSSSSPSSKKKNESVVFQPHSDTELLLPNNNNNNVNNMEETLKSGDRKLPFTDRLNKKIPFFGLFMSLLSVICFSLCSLIVKILTEYHALEILGIRSVFQVLFYLFTTLYFRLPFFGRPGSRLDIFLRALFGSIAALTIYMSYRLIPLADASTIQFSAPVLVFILAYFILGERLTLFHIFVGLLAFVGVVFVAKPKFIMLYFDPTIVEKINYNGIALALVAAVSTAFAMIMLRKLKTTPVHVVVLWFSIMTVVSAFGALMFIDKFIWPTDFRSWAWLVAIGLCGIGDQLFMTLAFKYESAGIVSVSRTMTIVLAFIWDTVLLDVIVHWSSVLGSSLVVLAVILLAVIKSMEDNPGLLHKILSMICCCCCCGCSRPPTPSREEQAEREKLLMTGRYQA